MTEPRTAAMTIFQLLGTMISTLQTMQDTTLILTLMIVWRTSVPIVTVISGLDHNTELIFAQMSWKYITKCLLETGQQQKTIKAKTTTATTTNQQNKQQR